MPSTVFRPVVSCHTGMKWECFCLLLSSTPIKFEVCTLSWISLVNFFLIFWFSGVNSLVHEDELWQFGHRQHAWQRCPAWPTTRSCSIWVSLSREQMNLLTVSIYTDTKNTEQVCTMAREWFLFWCHWTLNRVIRNSCLFVLSFEDWMGDEAGACYEKKKKKKKITKQNQTNWRPDCYYYFFLNMTWVRNRGQIANNSLHNFNPQAKFRVFKPGFNLWNWARMFVVGEKRRRIG